MSHETITIQGDYRVFTVEHWFSPERALVQYDGTYALVDRVNEGVFKLSSQLASEEEKEILTPLVEAMGTTTRVLETPGGRPAKPMVIVEEKRAAAPLNAFKAPAKKPKPGFCHCGTALSIRHDHADPPNLDKCWCGLYLVHVHSHASAPASPIQRCHCGILLSVPHEHAAAYDPSDKCECGLPMNPPHEHAGRIRGH